MVDYRILAMMFRRYALKNIDAPHGIGVSHPVVRTAEGKVCLAAFVYMLKREGMNQGCVPRPEYWIAIDPSSADLVKVYDCKEQDFSAQPFDAEYPVTEQDAALSALDFMDLYDKLDVVRKEIEDRGTVDKAEYESYFDLLIKLVPQPLTVFYRELSEV